MPARAGPETWASALAAATPRLAAAGCETPRLDAELLLAEAAGTERTRLYLAPETVLDAPAAARFAELIRRRADREPVAYLLGRRDFRNLVLTVDERVLIPRPETELLVEAALARLPPGARVADVGTGSGAVALALKDERPDLQVSATDLSADALSVARGNAERLGLEVTFHAGDLLDALDPGEVDAVVANLPYVPDGAPLAPEIDRYEPGLALFAGSDGLGAISRLCGALAGLASIRFVALEHGDRHAPAVEAIVREAGFDRIERLRDLAGHERVLTGRRSR